MADFHVTYPHAVLRNLEEFRQEAEDKNVQAKFLAAVTMIAANLKTNPREFGDPLFRYRHMKATLFVRAVSPLVVTYAVHEEKDIVFVKSIEKLVNAGF